MKIGIAALVNGSAAPHAGSNISPVKLIPAPYRIVFGCGGPRVDAAAVADVGLL